MPLRSLSTGISTIVLTFLCIFNFCFHPVGGHQCFNCTSCVDVIFLPPPPPEEDLSTTVATTPTPPGVTLPDEGESAEDDYGTVRENCTDGVTECMIWTDGFYVHRACKNETLIRGEESARNYTLYVLDPIDCNSLVHEMGVPELKWCFCTGHECNKHIIPVAEPEALQCVDCDSGTILKPSLCFVLGLLLVSIWARATNGLNHNSNGDTRTLSPSR